MNSSLIYKYFGIKSSGTFPFSVSYCLCIKAVNMKPSPTDVAISFMPSYYGKCRISFPEFASYTYWKPTSFLKGVYNHLCISLKHRLNISDVIFLFFCSLALFLWCVQYKWYHIVHQKDILTPLFWRIHHFNNSNVNKYNAIKINVNVNTKWGDCISSLNG